MNNVYIGSRYVPIFDGEWSAIKSYEALTIVDYGNNSYTSKRPVPVGVEPTNTDYWALTGNYNGQISHLQDEINDIQEQIDEIESHSYEKDFFRNKNIMIIGDSLTDPDTMAPNWVTLFKTMVESYGGTVNIDHCQDGDSFSAIGTDARLAEFNAFSDNFDYIIIALGINDYQGQWGLGYYNDTTDPDLTAGYNGYNAVAGQYKLLAKLRDICPHAIQFGCIPHRYGKDTARIPLSAYRYAFGTTYQMYGARIIDLSSMPMFSPTYNGNNFAGYTSSTDTLHPTSVYAPILMKYIKEKLMGGGDNYWKISGDSVEIAVEGSSGNIECCIYSDGRYHLECAVNFTSSWTDGYKTVIDSTELNYLLVELFNNIPASFNGGKPTILSKFGDDVIAYNPDGYTVSQLYINHDGHINRPTGNFNNIID